jgi:hypothetical protein
LQALPGNFWPRGLCHGESIHNSPPKY